MPYWVIKRVTIIYIILFFFRISNNSQLKLFQRQFAIVMKSFFYSLLKFILNNCKVIIWRKQFYEKFFCIIFRNIYVPQCLFSIKRSLAICKRWSCQKQEKKTTPETRETKFTQSCCKFSVNHSPRVQYVQLKSNSKKNFYLLDIFFILCIYFFWTNNKNQTIKHMHNVLLVLKYHSDTLSLLRLVPKTG